jgi:hypothetical protein
MGRPPSIVKELANSLRLAMVVVAVERFDHPGASLAFEKIDGLLKFLLVVDHWQMR